MSKLQEALAIMYPFKNVVAVDSSVRIKRTLILVSPHCAMTTDAYWELYVYLVKLFMWVLVWINVLMHVYVCVCMYVCMYVCVYAYVGRRGCQTQRAYAKSIT